jgi:hypothetical protein
MGREDMTLKTIALGAATMLLAGPAVAGDLYFPPTVPDNGPFYAAQPVVQAHVDLFGGVQSYSGEISSDYTYGLFGGAGRANLPIRNNWNVQVDAQGSLLADHDDSYVESAAEFAGYVHLYKRQPESHALGLLVGGGTSYYLHHLTFGVEGQMYWPRFTLYGQALVSRLSYGSDEAHAVQLRGEGQWYLTDNTVLIGNLIWSHLSEDSYNANVFSVGAGAMHRFHGGPVAGFVKVRWDHLSYDSAVGSSLTALAGVRVHADPPMSTLKSHLRTGPAMNVEQVLFSLVD